MSSTCRLTAQLSRRHKTGSQKHEQQLSVLGTRSKFLNSGTGPYRTSTRPGHFESFLISGTRSYNLGLLQSAGSEPSMRWFQDPMQNCCTFDDRKSTDASIRLTILGSCDLKYTHGLASGPACARRAFRGEQPGNVGRRVLIAAAVLTLVFRSPRIRVCVETARRRVAKTRPGFHERGSEERPVSSPQALVDWLLLVECGLCFWFPSTPRLPSAQPCRRRA